MTLNEFVEHLKLQVDHFEKTYKKGMEVDPENWPAEMDAADWFDQFTSSVS